MIGLRQRSTRPNTHLLAVTHNLVACLVVSGHAGFDLSATIHGAPRIDAALDCLLGFRVLQDDYAVTEPHPAIWSVVTTIDIRRMDSPKAGVSSATARCGLGQGL